jgi:DNA-binding transcriptional ArsR family regulator
LLVPAEAASVFAALGDPTRLGLVERLAEDGGQRSLSELAGGLPVTRQAVTRHLRVLETAGLVTSLRAGRETRFSLVPDRVDALRSYLETVDRRWDEALERLRIHLDGKS